MKKKIAIALLIAIIAVGAVIIFLTSGKQNSEKVMQPQTQTGTSSVAASNNSTAETTSAKKNVSLSENGLIELQDVQELSFTELRTLAKKRGFKETVKPYGPTKGIEFVKKTDKGNAYVNLAYIDDKAVYISITLPGDKEIKTDDYLNYFDFVSDVYSIDYNGSKHVTKSVGYCKLSCKKALFGVYSGEALHESYGTDPIRMEVFTEDFYKAAGVKKTLSQAYDDSVKDLQKEQKNNSEA